MKSWEITSNVVRSIASILLMTTLCLAQLNTNKQGFVNTKGRKILPSNSTLKIETATSSIACSTLCCLLGSCCYASYDKKTRQCILEESCCPQSELSGEALMMKKTTGSSQCLNGWFQNGNKCYFFSDVFRNWTDAKSFCDSYGSMLVEVISSCELDFLNTEANDAIFLGYWLGGTDIEKEGDWIWSTSQSQITLNAWEVGQPDNLDGEHCLFMLPRRNLTWRDARCTTVRRFICEKNLFN